MKDFEKELVKRAEYIITNHNDDHERARCIMSEQAFRAIAWFIEEYGLDIEYEIHRLSDEEAPQELPF